MPRPDSLASPNPEEPAGDRPAGADGQAGAFPLLAHLGRFWTAANALSLLRVATVPLIAARLWAGGDWTDGWLVGALAFGVLTDFFDGKVARWSHTVSEWGKVLDPLADKFAAIVIVGALALRPDPPRPDAHNLSPWLLWLILGRDAILVAGSFALKRRIGRVAISVFWGKAAVFMLTLVVIGVVIGLDERPLRLAEALTGALFVLSFLLYVGRFGRMMRRGHPAHDPAAGTPHAA